MQASVETGKRRIVTTSTSLLQYRIGLCTQLGISRNLPRRCLSL